MSTIQSMWQTIETEHNTGIFPDDQLKKIDELVYSDDIENIRNGLTLMTTLAPEYLCRYLTLEGDSVVLRDAEKFTAPLSTERVLVESAKGESMWQALYESVAFDSMEFRALGDVAIENLSESEKAFCVRIAKEMVRVPAGEFMMGALEDDEDAYDDERPRHKVTLTRDVLMGKYQVTQAFWESVMGSNPSKFKGANRPVEKVSWFDCVLFCNKLSKREGLEPAYIINGKEVTCDWTAKGYRLPTEAEWEYSARGGEYHKYAGSDDVDEVAWYDGNSGNETHPVGQKKPNGFGLYDMSGNVWEWCWDRMEYDDDEDEIVGDSVYRHGLVMDPYGSEVGPDRVIRGGGWIDNPKFVRASFRNLDGSMCLISRLGFRIERSLDVQ